MVLAESSNNSRSCTVLNQCLKTKWNVGNQFALFATIFGEYITSKTYGRDVNAKPEIWQITCNCFVNKKQGNLN